VSKKLIHGVGVNDAGYVTQKYEYIEGRTPSGIRKRKSVWRCPYYSKWESMLARCYSIKYLETRTAYRGCTVCDEWLLFSNFRKWMVMQDWAGNQLDKDILVEGNKIYSPETCIFVVQKINTFMGDCGDVRGNYLVGSSLPKNTSRFSSQCSNPFKDKGDLRKRHMGLFDSEVEAHLAWKKRKHEYAVELANSEYVTDDRVRQALIYMYENYTIVEDHLK
tara:strand:- start:2407 stop:3066 length:660 start_codon:yes stop_codon:yes gene_type:complete